MICGKRIYTTQSDAKNAIKGHNHSMGAYFCKDCNGWHIASEGKESVLNTKKQPQKQELNTKPENIGTNRKYIIHDPRKFKIK